ncbi:type II secretion system F family protein [Planctomycetes bacterium K23_9]|uniref:Bacterial type II secretion system protein F domain protein n=1 Tax=Stieleria marina TaxID=1930275 RepID=A0A517NYZ9_9BACT|nr:Bacterial type II secretion system protein F domain protein [Planctomycetes bacterium K23_9]
MISLVDVFVFCAFVTVTGLAALLVKRRKSESESTPEDSPPPALLRVRRDAALNNDVLKNAAQPASMLVRLDQAFERILIRGGVQSDRGTCTVLLICVSLLAAIVAFVLELHVAVQVLSMMGVLTLGVIVFYARMTIRMNKFATLFPTAIELLARATKSGSNLESAFQIAGQSCEEPIKGEFLQCVRQMQLGLTPARVAEDLAERIDSVEVHLLSHTIAVHQRLGGKLSDCLERLSSSIRDRSQCEDKIKSMTSIARYSVAGIVLMGVFVLIYMLTVEPEYVDNLFTSSLGMKLLVYAGVSELVGLIWVGLALKSDL